MYIFIVRHGQTEWNKINRVQGTSDIRLNETGIQQAKRTSHYFKDLKFDALITSPLQRTIETGKYLTQYCTVGEIKTDRRIIEKHFGICEGMDIDERYKFYPNGHAPQEESYQIVKKRMKEAIVEYAQTYTHNILVVSHGSAMAALIKAIDSTYENTFLRFDNTSVTIINSKTLKVAALNLIDDAIQEWIQKNIAQ